MQEIAGNGAEEERAEIAGVFDQAAGSVQESDSGQPEQATVGSMQDAAEPDNKQPVAGDRPEPASGESGVLSPAEPDTAAQIAALDAENASLRGAFEPLYTKIGQNFYEKPQGYELVIAAAVEQLAGMDAKIHENYLHTLRLKGIRYCPQCERIVDDATVFCGDCGTRIDPVEIVDETSILCACCGAKNDREKRFCIKCGQRLAKGQDNMICCPSCKTWLPADARFCEECGTKLVQEANSSE